MPRQFDSVIFDLDGVITKTAVVHAKAWKEGFDEYLSMRHDRDGEPFKEFTYERDYLTYVDGKPRYEGVKSFLESRNIQIPYGEPEDSPETETVCGIGNKKNAKFMEILRRDGAEIFPSTIELIKELKSNNIRIGVASSSKNCQDVLQAAGIEELFETRVDGKVSAQMGLRGKPEGDIFVQAARNLGTLPCRSVVVEDATSGVSAGRNGGFGLVLGIARENNEKELCAHGADVVVRDLAPVTASFIDAWFEREPAALIKAWDKETAAAPCGLKSDNNILINPHFSQSAKALFSKEKKLVFFLDYDGTLTPIVSRPELAHISSAMRQTVERLSKNYTTAIVSGRLREDVEQLAGIKGIVYAGSHGFDIKGEAIQLLQPQAKEAIPVILKLIEELKEKLARYEGVIVEEKKFSVAVHYRLAKETDLPQIKALVSGVIEGNGAVRIMSGKKVFEILPAIDWDKGKALRWIMKALSLDWQDSLVVYIGDDTTDEDAFRMIRTRGTGILVAKEPRPSAADFYLSSPDEVQLFFDRILSP